MSDISNHAQFRAAQRQFSIEAIQYITTYGQEFHKAGARFYYLRSVDIPVSDQCIDYFMKLEGCAVVLTRDECTVITCWRNRKRGLKRIKHKPDY